MTTSKDKYSNSDERLKAVGEKSAHKTDEHGMSKRILKSINEISKKQNKPFMDMVPIVNPNLPTPVERDAIDHVNRCNPCRDDIAKDLETKK